MSMLFGPGGSLKSSLAGSRFMLNLQKYITSIFRYSQLCALFLLPAWLLTLGIGVPLFAFINLLLERRAEQSAEWRFVACFALACAITPSIFPFDGVMLLIPAVFVFVGIFEGNFQAVLLGACPLLAVSFVLLGIWSFCASPKSKDITPETD
jgi:hypothetical protein